MPADVDQRQSEVDANQCRKHDPAGRDEAPAYVGGVQEVARPVEADRVEAFERGAVGARHGADPLSDLLALGRLAWEVRALDGLEVTHELACILHVATGSVVD